MVRKDGTKIPMEFSTRKLDDGRIQTIGRDVRVRRRLEARLRQSEKMEAVGRLAGGVAHDFNNLLTAIRGHTQLGPAELRGEHPVRDDVEAVDRAAKRAAQVVSKLLAFSRRQPADPRIVDLNEALREMRKTLLGPTTERVEESLDLDPDAGCVRVDPVQIEQVVLNLLLNAREAMPDGGRVTIETAPVEVEASTGAERVRGLPAGRYVRLRVRDEGVGMDEDTVGRIFEPFYTEKGEGKGTGLGLASVYGIVEEAGGVIRVESEPGEGSIFDLDIPRVECREREPDQRE